MCSLFSLSFTFLSLLLLCSVGVGGVPCGSTPDLTCRECLTNDPNDDPPLPCMWDPAHGQCLSLNVTDEDDYIVNKTQCPDPTCWMVSYCNGKAYALAAAGAVVGVFSLAVMGFSVVLAMKEQSFQDRLPLLRSHRTTSSIQTNSSSPATLTPKISMLKFINYFTFIGSVISFFSLCLLVWIPMAAFCGFMSLFFVVFVLFMIMKKWGLAKAIQIVLSSKQVDFAQEFASTANPFSEGSFAYLQECASVVGDNPTIHYKHMSNSRIRGLIIFGIIVLPILLMILGMVSSFLFIETVNPAFKILIFVIVVGMFGFVYLFAGSASYSVVVTDTHWISFTSGFSLIPLEHCITINTISEIEFTKVSLFGVTSNSVVIKSNGAYRGVWGGYFDSETDFHTLARKLGFESAAEDSCRMCTLPPLMFFVLQGVVYLTIIGLFIAGAYIGFLFAMIVSIVPMLWMMVSMVIGSLFVQQKEKFYKRM